MKTKIRISNQFAKKLVVLDIKGKEERGVIKQFVRERVREY